MDSAPVRRYLNGIGLSHVQTLEDGLYHAYHQDEQGSTVYITEENRQVQNSYRYDAFGNLLESKEDIENRILYTGQQYDQETGQYYLRARYYNPVIGRFTQEDTYRGDGLNLYAYCANNPVMYYDPSGNTMENDCTGGTKAEELEETEVASVKKKIYSDEELINAVYDIHDAQYGDAWWGKKNPVTMTQATDGTEVVSKNNGVIGPQSRQRTVEIFGDDVVIVQGRGAKNN